MKLNIEADVFVHWLQSNKITPEIQKAFNISFTDKIVFPVHDMNGVFLFNKYRRSPLTEEGSKYTYDIGSKVSLYGCNHIKTDHTTILITEGEKDCLVAWSNNIPAVTSTGGALSFQKDWADMFTDKEVIICLDNDKAGGDGMVKVLEYLPQAKVIFIPDMPNVKDISDYVAVGGNLHELLKTARTFTSLSEVNENRSERLATFRSVYFHDAYIKKHTKINNYVGDRKPSFSSDVVTKAKEYPLCELIEFNAQKKALCPFHHERTPSLQYYPKTNSCYCFGCGKAYDSIAVYRHLHNCTFKEAVDALNK